MSVRKLVTCSMCAALAVVTNLIRIYTFPFGGSVTLFSMLFIILPAWFYGVREGFIVGLLFGIIQFIIEPFFLSVPQVILDYVLAFSIMGIAGIVRNKKNGLITGYVIAVIARWVVATFAGHYVFNDGRGYGYDDGLYAALRVLEYLSQSSHSTISELFEKYPERCCTEDTYIHTDHVKPELVLAEVESKSHAFNAQLSTIE